MALPYLTKDRNGTWYYRLRGEPTFHTLGIKVRYGSDGLPTKRSQAEADAAAAAKWEEYGDRFGSPDDLRTFLDPYYNMNRCPHIARVISDRGRYNPETAKGQRSRIRRLVLEHWIADREVPTKGTRPTPNQLTPGDIEDWKRSLRAQEVGARTINAALTDLKTALAEGVHRGELAYNPAASVRGVRQVSEHRGYFTAEEIRAMFSDPENWRELRKTKKGRIIGLPTHFRYAFAVALFALGQRPETVRHLQWGMLSGDVLNIPGEIVKTARGLVVPVCRQLVDVLEEHRERSIRIADTDYIFAHDSGEAVGDKWFRRPFWAMLRHCGIPETDPEGDKRTPYSLKSSLITLLIDSGVDPVAVREYVGHSHGSGERALTPVQARYKGRQVERLRAEVVPVIEGLLE